MRRLVIVATALGLMWGLPHMTIVRENGAVNPLTLAAIGFVLLAAFAVGEFGVMLKLPRVTGYIVSGVILGPFVLNILSTGVAVEMQGFNTLALGLIALTAGLELDIRSMSKVSRTLLSTIILKIPVLLFFVGGTFYVFQTYYPIFPGLSHDAVIALSLLFSIFAIGTSPALAIAVVSETKSKGRLSDLVLAISVAKDLVVVICLALGISYARATLTPAGQMDIHTLLRLGKELGMSLGAGAVLGALIFLYTRFIGRELLMMLLVIVVAAAEVSRIFHLELLLLLIAAGFVVRNFSAQEHRLLEQLNRVSLPVFVVFFTTAGANVDLAASRIVLPLAAALVIARALAYVMAGKLGGRIGRESKSVRQNAWMTYLPQAGVTLGLLLIAAEALPELATPIRQTGMTVVAINLLIGPILMSIGLKRSGEVPSTRNTGNTGVEPIPLETIASQTQWLKMPEDASTESVDDGISPRLPRARSGVPDGSHTKIMRDNTDGRISTVPESATASVRAMTDQLYESISLFTANSVRPLEKDGAATVAKLLDGKNKTEISENVAELLQVSTPPSSDRWEKEIEQFLKKLFGTIADLPPLAIVSMRWKLLQRNTGDSPRTDLQKFVLRRMVIMNIGHAHLREIPLRLLARITLEPRLAEAGVLVASSWYRTMLRALELVQQAISDQLDPQTAVKSIHQIFRDWGASVSTDFHMALQSGARQMDDYMETVGAPSFPARTLRYSTVSPAVQEASRRLWEQAAEWRKTIDSAFQTVRLVALLHITEQRLAAITRQRLIDPFEQLQAQLPSLLEQICLRFEELKTTAEKNVSWNNEGLSNLLNQANNIFPKDERVTVRGMVANFRRITRKSAVARETAAVMSLFPEKMKILPSGIRAESVFSPDDSHVFEARPEDTLDLFISEEYSNTMIAGPSQLGLLLVSAEPALREAVHLVTYGIEVAIRKGESESVATKELVLSAIIRALQRTSQLRREISTAMTAIETAVADTLGMLPGHLAKIQHPGHFASELIRGESFSRTGAKVSQWWQEVKDRGLDIWERGSEKITGASKRRAEEWRIHTGEERLDASGIHRYCSTRFPGVNKLHLPPIYMESHSLEPVSDRRLLSARRKLMDEVFTSLNDMNDLTNFLIVGDRGAGRSTFAAEMHFRLTGRRVYRFDGALFERGCDVISTLAEEIGCIPEELVLLENLKQEKTIIIIDDVEQLLKPDTNGAAVFNRWMDFIVQTLGFSRWLVTMNSGVWQLIREINPLSSRGFAHIISLPPLTWKELRELIAKRQRLAGIPCLMGRQLGPLDFLFNRRTGARERQYFRTLESVSNGNIRRALLFHLYSLALVEKSSHSDSDQPQYSLIAKQPRLHILPFFPWMESEVISILALSIKLGALSAREIQKFLSVSDAHIRGILFFLMQTGLMESHKGGVEEKLRVPVHLVDAVTRELTRLQLYEKGAQ